MRQQRILTDRSSAALLNEETGSAAHVREVAQKELDHFWSEVRKVEQRGLN
ncbi:hypothetical protein [Cohnella silvisoli]|uniref:Uncharacterized protein n=1 Tax=Cohnella silvisoli TaxID=2873699 RepID=A0ABV1KRK7_9BACL|nr:hypothetical protein [Cohnella silvisoli]MCD9021715.1 hypothetical protein [Cohnella silvisoli]